jgi:hypothetical protein
LFYCEPKIKPIMKKKSLFLLCFLCFIFLFSSFNNKGANDIEFKNSMLVGTWQFSKVGVVENGNEILEKWEGTPECDTEHMIFKADKTGATVEYDEWNGECEEVKVPFEWSLSGGVLKFGSEADFSEVDVIELTERVLKIYEEDEWRGERIVSVLVFTKI